MWRLILVIIAILMFSSNAGAQIYDVAGVKLGMNESEVERQIRLNGFLPDRSNVYNDHRKPSYTFAQKVRIADGARLLHTEKTGLLQLKFIKYEKENLVVRFIELPEGAFVSFVEYKLSDPSVSPAEFVQNVRTKYGLPTDDSMNIGSIYEGEAKLQIGSIRADETLIARRKKNRLTLEADIDFAAYKRSIEDARPRRKVTTSF